MLANRSQGFAVRMVRAGGFFLLDKTSPEQEGLMRFLNATLVLSALTFSTAANAALVSQGVGFSTLDTVSGLEWLDVTSSGGLSYADVSSQFGPSGSFAGYRYATAPEVAELLSHAGITQGSSASSYDTAWAFIQLFGETTTVASADTTVHITNGLHEPGGPGGFSYTKVEAGVSDFGSGPIYATKVTTSNDPGFFGGSWLVRAAANQVPEPGTLALVGLLLGMVARRRRLR